LVQTREVRELVARARRGWPSPLPALLALAASAIVLVSAVDFALQWLGYASGAPWRDIPITWQAWTTNVLIVFAALALCFALSRRMAVALLLVGGPYLLLGASSLAKLYYMQSAVQPLDILALPEFLPLFRTQFGTPVAVAGVLLLVGWGGMLWLSLRRAAPPFPLLHRLTLGAVALVLVLAVPLALLAGSSEVTSAVIRWSGAPDGQWKDQSKRTGLLLSFVTELPSALIAEPHGYSRDTLLHVAARYAPSPSAATRRSHINLIVYLVESLMDPADLGVRFTEEPTPVFRTLRTSGPAGFAIVPNEFGGSANTEFELLTGMSTAFLPRGSLAYRQYLKRPVPSLVGRLRCEGYTTTAVQPDPRFYYDRERAYRLLGFDRVAWPDDVPDVSRDPRNGWPTDSVVVNAILEASAGPRPFFVFAFPSSTHSYYRSGVYRDSRLDPIDSLPPEAAAEVKEYVNALRVADRELGRLIEAIRHRPDSTVVLVLGDHLPPLSSSAYQRLDGALASAAVADQAERRRRVPLAVWASFPLAHDSLLLSVNQLSGYLLDILGLPPRGLIGLTDSLRRRVPVLTRAYLRGRDGAAWGWDSMPEEIESVVKDYRLLQYDLLLGEQFTFPARPAKAADVNRGTASRPPC
jgi:phosphoglycerol transferase MdoB-like AlkP superfamily enzyme